MKSDLAKRRAGERGQSAVETTFMLPIFILIFIGMYELFTVTFAAQHAHMRAREYLLHQGAYTQGSNRPPWEGGSNMPAQGVFDVGQRNYRIAEVDMWGKPGSRNFGFEATAEDWAWAGITDGGNVQGAHIEAKLVICSPYGCPGGARD